MNAKTNAHIFISAIPFSFRLLWQYDKKLFLFYLLSTTNRVVHSFLLIFFPKILLDALTNGNIAVTCVCVIVFGLLQWGVSILSSWIENKRVIASEDSIQHFKLLLINKLTTLRHEQIEDPQTLAHYEMAQKAIDNRNVEKVIATILSIIAAIITIAGTIYILNEFPIMIWIVIFLVSLLSSFGQVKRARYEHSEMSEETPIERELYYLRGRLMNKEYAKEIRSFQLNEFISEKCRNAINAFFSLIHKYDLKHSKILWWTYAIDGAQTVVLYSYNAVLFAQKEISISTFSMNISALLQFSSALNQVLSGCVSITEQGMFLTEFQSFLDLDTSYTGHSNIEERFSHTIDFVDVCFRYPGQTQNAIDHISLKILPNEKISIVGANGAGKSTFIKLMLGLYKPTSGCILLDGKNIEQYDPQEYLSIFASVMQDYQIFSFKISENIVFSDTVSQDLCNHVYWLLQDLGLKETIDSLPNGVQSYLTQLYDDSGIELSGGECQKIALARALFRNAPIVILDEPTSALSPRSEYELYSQFAKLTKGKTIFFISHRMSSCSLCDRILVFNSGRIIQDGSHKELMAQKGEYYHMFQSQASLYDFRVFD